MKLAWRIVLGVATGILVVAVTAGAWTLHSIGKGLEGFGQCDTPWSGHWNQVDVVEAMASVDILGGKPVVHEGGTHFWNGTHDTIPWSISAFHASNGNAAVSVYAPQEPTPWTEAEFQPLARELFASLGLPEPTFEQYRMIYTGSCNRM